MAFDNIYVKDATSVIIQVMLRDSDTGMGKTGIAYSSVGASYCRPGGTRQAITVISGTAGDSYSSGKWAEVDSTNMPGLYQFHIPDAALATGANSCELNFVISGVLSKSTKIVLIDANLRDAMRLGMTALPNANAGANGGLPLSADASGRVDVLKINGTSQTARDIGASVLVGDKTGFSLTAGEHTNIATDVQTGMTAQGYTATRAGYLDLLTAIWRNKGRIYWVDSSNGNDSNDGLTGVTAFATLEHALSLFIGDYTTHDVQYDTGIIFVCSSAANYTGNYTVREGVEIIGLDHPLFIQSSTGTPLFKLLNGSGVSGTRIQAASSGSVDILVQCESHSKFKQNISSTNDGATISKYIQVKDGCEIDDNLLSLACTNAIYFAQDQARNRCKIRNNKISKFTECAIDATTATDNNIKENEILNIPTGKHGIKVQLGGNNSIVENNYSVVGTGDLYIETGSTGGKANLIQNNGAAGTGTGLTAQETRDAMSLTPTVNPASAPVNSIDEVLFASSILDRGAIEYNFTSYSNSVMLFYGVDRPFGAYDPLFWCFVYTASGGKPTTIAEIAKRDMVYRWSDTTPDDF
jgi:hypothetical protein